MCLGRLELPRKGYDMMTRRVDNIYLYTGDLQLVYHKKGILHYRVFFNYVDKILTT